MDDHHVAVVERGIRNYLYIYRIKNLFIFFINVAKDNSEFACIGFYFTYKLYVILQNITLYIHIQIKYQWLSVSCYPTVDFF